MIKKLIALAAGALLSMNASAGYIQYNLSGGGISGYFVQNDQDKSIAIYSFSQDIGTIRYHYYPSGTYGNLSGASSSYWGVMGPTDFTIYDRASEVYIRTISFYFNGNRDGDMDHFAAFYSQEKDPGYPSAPWVIPLQPMSTWLNGTVTRSEVDPRLADFLSAFPSGGYYPDLIPYIVPLQNVPEPGSLALLGAGALGLAGLRRRRAARRA